MKHIPLITIESIPHKAHRYETVGDYFKTNKAWNFRVSKMSNQDYEFLVIMHEMIEWYLTQKRGITEKSILKFDIQYEKEREQGLHSQDDEPGFDKKAPYRKEHAFATEIEKLLAKELKVNWNKYDKEVMSL
jgi:hypothetical protein